jgi:hypothetical protein
METITIIVLISNIFTFLLILRQLYRLRYHRKIIIIANKNKNIFLTMFFVVIIIISISGYLDYTQKQYGYIFDVLLAILYIETIIIFLIKYLYSEIRENGIYISGRFYKWSKFQSYSWVSPTTIQFKVNTLSTDNYNLEIIIKEELKSKVNETVQKYVLRIYN